MQGLGNAASGPKRPNPQGRAPFAPTLRCSALAENDYAARETPRFVAKRIPARPLTKRQQPLGIFGILYLGEHAVVLGQDDRHLDFRLVLQWQPGWLRIATLVRPHNLLGRGYLAWVTPWHHLIAGASGRRMAAALQSERSLAA
ncbi:DUF2867 domain-containing protein [Chromobacterium amazonense]|uniref:DUF2867 domain-containing protein n=1 Tax=Chromobacterium amazonense TaxID=1382803 RepID=A0ABU8V7J8_9NEIS